MVLTARARGFVALVGAERGSTILSVMNDTTNVSSSTEAAENQKFAVRSIDRLGSIR